MTNIAFSKTIEPMREFRKTVTRRYSWYNARAGDILWAVEKSQGLKRGEKVQRIHEIQLLTPRWERLDLMLTDQAYGEREVILEGFPELSPKEFVEMLCEMDKKRPEELVHRLEFRFLLRHKIFPYKGKCYLPTFFYYEDGTMGGGMIPKPNSINEYLGKTFRFELS